MYVKLFDRSHIQLDELYQFSPPKYGWTLNDIDTMALDIALSDPKCTPANMQLGNHLEYAADDGTPIWGGYIAGHSFDDAKLTLNCVDYNALLKYRRLRAKQYATMDYGTLNRQLIDDAQAARPDYPIGLTGYSIAAGAIDTTREVKATDLLLAKLKDINADANYDYWMDEARVYHFAHRRGADKPQYVLEYGGEADNIIAAPTLARDILNLANDVYAESTVTDDSNNSTTITSEQQDASSQSTYGLYEGTFSPNDGVTDQSTLDTQTQAALALDSAPADSITLTCTDGTLCPFDDLTIGDRVTLHLLPYFDYTASVRVLRMVQDDDKQTREITVGSVVYKPQGPQRRAYQG